MNKYSFPRFKWAVQRNLSSFTPETFNSLQVWAHLYRSDRFRNIWSQKALLVARALLLSWDCPASTKQCSSITNKYNISNGIEHSRFWSIEASARFLQKRTYFGTFRKYTLLLFVWLYQILDTYYPLQKNKDICFEIGRLYMVLKACFTIGRDPIGLWTSHSLLQALQQVL